VPLLRLERIENERLRATVCFEERARKRANCKLQIAAEEVRKAEQLEEALRRFDFSPEKEAA